MIYVSYTEITHIKDICSNSNKIRNSYSNLGYNFRGYGLGYGRKRTQKFLAGSYYFLVSEIEVGVSWNFLNLVSAFVE